MRGVRVVIIHIDMAQRGWHMDAPGGEQRLCVWWGGGVRVMCWELSEEMLTGMAVSGGGRLSLFYMIQYYSFSILLDLKKL